MPTPASQQPQALPTPILRLSADTLFIEGARSFEVTTAVLRLDFEYAPNLHVRCDSARSLHPLAARDRAAEVAARRVLEGLGAIELSQLDDVAATPGAHADYVIAVEPDPHALCAFSAYALPQLRALGWRVEVAADYPWQVVADDAPWFCAARADHADKPSWFALELGVEIDGRAIDLVPALLDLLDGCDDLAALTRPTRRCIAVHVDATRWLPVPPAQLARLAATLLALYRDGGRPTARAAELGAFAELCATLHDGRRPLSWRGDPAIRERAFELALGPHALAFDPTSDSGAAIARRFAPPAGLRAELRPYQQAGVAWLQHLRAHNAGGVLADDMGLGKTLQTIAHIATEHDHGRLDRPAMIVAPTSLIGNWMRELARFAPHLRALAYHGPDRAAVRDRLAAHDVVVTSYPIVARDHDALAAIPLHLVILDEAHAIKNCDAQIADAVRALDARHRVCLTGTPIENHLGELWSLLDFAHPGLLGSRDDFAHHFRQPIEERGDRGRLAALRERVRPFVLRRTKDAVAPELPAKTTLIRAVELAGAQRELYESIRVAAHADVRRHIRERGLARSAIAVLDALLKLRQACCDPRLVDLPAQAAADAPLASAKLDALLQLVERGLADGRRILVFSQFARMLALIGEALLARGTGHAMLTGRTVDRQRPIDAFQQGRVDVLLISLKAGGSGLNLTGADTVVHYDPWWNPAAQAQATDRAHRIGQDKPVFVHQLIAAGSVEERMLGLQRHKRRLADAVLDGGAGTTAALSERDVDDLLAPLA